MLGTASGGLVDAWTSLLLTNDELEEEEEEQQFFRGL
jgi:hypothetical protein